MSTYLSASGHPLPYDMVQNKANGHPFPCLYDRTSSTIQKERGNSTFLIIGIMPFQTQ